MTTIAEENRKTLRRAMDVRCGFAEATEATANVVPFGHLVDYEGLANANDEHKVGIFMDLAGDGFKNDGEAIPMETDSTTYRYGYISAGVADPDGSFTGGFGVTVTSTTHWAEATMLIVGQYGEQRTVHYEMDWSGDVSVLEVTGWTPGTRASIVGVYLGRSWLWDNSNLISVNLDLHGVNTEIGGELEISSIEIRAYETTDYTETIGDIAIGSPIWYTAGYDGDMSPTRTFYLSEPISWQDNVLTVRGQDATMFLENKETPGHYEYSYVFPKDLVLLRMDEALDGINYRELWSAGDDFFDNADPPPVVYLPAAAPRSIISNYVNIFRGQYLHAMYIDAGIPTQIQGPLEQDRVIYADEISDLDSIAEQNINTVGANIFTNYFRWMDPIETVEATSGKTYFVDLDPPCMMGGSDVQITPAPASWTRLSPNRLKFKAAATTTYTISGWQIPDNYDAGDDPFKVTGLKRGGEYIFDMPVQAFEGDLGSLTRFALPDLLKRSNVIYEFNYRGDPWMQPRDVLDVEIATWETVKKYIDGLFPAADLYPSTGLYPAGEYKYIRKPVRRWETMTVDSLTLEHSEGGLVSHVKARKGRI